jgi:hypothetical protein
VAGVRLASNDVSVLLGMGDGRLREAVFCPHYFGSSVAIAIGNLNADRRLDIALALSNTNDVVARLGKGDGSFPTYNRYKVGDEAESSTSREFRCRGRESNPHAPSRGHLILSPLGRLRPVSARLENDCNRLLFRSPRPPRCLGRSRPIVWPKCGLDRGDSDLARISPGPRVG